MRRLKIAACGMILCFALVGCSETVETVPKEEYDKTVAQNQELTQQITDLETEIEEIKQQTLIPQLKQEAAEVDKTIANIGNVTLESEAAIQAAQTQYDALEEDVKQYVTGYATLSAAQDRLKELKSSQTDAQKSQSYKDACNVGYSYKELARDPNTYVGKQAKFVGKVIQVTEGSGITVMRINVTQNSYSWEDTFYVTYTPKSGEPRILEDDIVTMYGELQPLKTYTTVMGASVSIPALEAKFIDVNK